MSAKLYYEYDPNTGEYLGSGKGDRSPLEPGVYLNPAHSTWIAPPEFSEGQNAFFLEDKQCWEVRCIKAILTERELAFRSRMVDKAKRDCLSILNSTVWACMDDAPLTLEEKTQWLSYRQAIGQIYLELKRDPATIEQLQWPQPPEL